MSSNSLLYPNALALNCSTINCSGLISGGNIVAPIITASNVLCDNLFAEYALHVHDGGTIDGAIITNSTITSSTNNVIARALFDSSGSGFVSTYASSSPVTGQVLTATSPTTAVWQTPAGGAGISVQNVTVTLNTAALATLHTVPVTVLAAPGAGKLIIPLSYYVQYTYSTSQYTGGGGGVLLSYSGTPAGEGTDLYLIGVGDGIAANSFYLSSPISFTIGEPPANTTPLTNLGLILSSGAAITGGLGSYQIDIQYIVVSV